MEFVFGVSSNTDPYDIYSMPPYSQSGPRVGNLLFIYRSNHVHIPFTYTLAKGVITPSTQRILIKPTQSMKLSMNLNRKIVGSLKGNFKGLTVPSKLQSLLASQVTRNLGKSANIGDQIRKPRIIPSSNKYNNSFCPTICWICVCVV